MTYDEMLEKLRNREPFAFSRWGDGEWNAILGKTGANCDGHKYFRDMGDRLGDILKQMPGYYLGMQSLAKRNMGIQIGDFFKIDTCFDGRATNLNWIDADIIHKASEEREGFVHEFLGAAVDALLVGPGWLRQMYPFGDLVEVPERNAWRLYPTIQAEVERVLNLCYTDNKAIMFACGPLANVLIDDFYWTYGDRLTLIDVGSVFDPYCGKCTRKYHKKVRARLEDSSSHSGQ